MASRKLVWIAILVFVVIAAGPAAVWYRFHQHELDLLRTRSVTTVDQTGFRLEGFISMRLHLVRQLTKEWLEQRINTEERFRDMALTLQGQFSSFQAINWVDPDGVIRWVVPEEPNLPAKDRDLRTHAGLDQVLQKAARSAEPVASPPLDLFQGGRGFGTYFPLIRDGRLEGYINGVFRIRPLVDDCLRKGVHGDFFLRITDAETRQELYSDQPASYFVDSPMAVRHDMKALDRVWTVTLAPTPVLIASVKTHVDELLLAIALLLAAGFACTLSLYIKRQDALRLTQFAMDHAAAAAFWVDSNAKLTYVNEAACRSLGYTREELLSMTVFDIDPIYPRESWVENWEKVKRGESRAIETIHRTQDGKEFPVEVSVNYLDYKGREYHFTIARNLSESKRAEAERLRMERQLLEAQKLESLGLLAGGIAHDFNNLLTAMMGNASLASERVGPDSPVRNQLEQIEIAAQQAADLARQLLAYSGKGKFVVTAVDVCELIREIGHLLRVSVPRQIELKYDLADRPLYVRADASQIRQVIMNLVVNGAEAIGEKSGTVTIRTDLIAADRAYLDAAFSEADLPEGPYVALEVSDTGSGMDAETRARIFEPFFSTKARGRGLGLAAVMGILRGHAGAMKVYSEPGKGTRFKVLLPSSDAPAEVAKVDEQQVSSRPAGGTILVVDDEDSVRTVAKVILEDSGYAVLTARDGVEGVEMFRAHSAEITAVLLDMTMPRLSGKEAFEEMRKIRSDVRILLSSGYNEQEATNEFAGQGVAGFIQKPYRADQLLRKIEEIVAA